MAKKQKFTVDTRPGTTWQEFIEIAKAYGFKCGLCQKFTGDAREGGVEEEEVILFHEEKGLILYATSYDKTMLNDAYVYGEVKMTKEKDYENLHILFRPNVNENSTCSFSIQVIYGLCYRLELISKNYKFSKTWSTKQSLCFINYMDREVKNYNREEINCKKIAACVPEVRKIIFG